MFTTITRELKPQFSSTELGTGAEAEAPNSFSALRTFFCVCTHVRLRAKKYGLGNTNFHSQHAKTYSSDRCGTGVRVAAGRLYACSRAEMCVFEYTDVAWFYMRAWLTPPHGRRHKAPPLPCALTTKKAVRPVALGGSLFCGVGRWGEGRVRRAAKQAA